MPIPNPWGLKVPARSWPQVREHRSDRYLIESDAYALDGASGPLCEPDALTFLIEEGFEDGDARDYLRTLRSRGGAGCLRPLVKRSERDASPSSARSSSNDASGASGKKKK